MSEGLKGAYQPKKSGKNRGTDDTAEAVDENVDVKTLAYQPLSTSTNKHLEHFMLICGVEKHITVK